MENIRVYEAAKELGLTNKEIIEQLETKIGVKVKSHSSTLTMAQFKRFKDMIQANAAPIVQKRPKAFIVKKVKTETPKEEKIIQETKETKEAKEEPPKEMTSSQKPAQNSQNIQSSQNGQNSQNGVKSFAVN